MRRCAEKGLVYYQFDSFPDDAVQHALFTRLGGVSRSPFASLNLGRSVGDDPEAIEQNYARVCEVLNVARGQLVTAHQVHSDHVAVVGPADAGKLLSLTDALMSDSPDVTLTLRFADCVPVLLADPVKGVVGVAHAGWKGSLNRIAARTIEAMEAQYGCRAADVVAGIGPSIGPCCYRIREDVAAGVREAFADTDGILWSDPDGSTVFDLWEANRRVLNEAGVSRVEMSGLCTSCRCNEFYSHRREDGRTGRAAVFIRLQR